jgi:hypothetical protein
MPNPGVDVYVIDEALGGGAELATDTLYLLSANGPAAPVRKTKADDADTTINNYLRAYFMEGGRSVYLAGYDPTGATKPTPANAVKGFGAGPGQVVAPELVTSADMIAVGDAAWGANKVYLANGPTSATIAALQTLSTAVRAGSTTGGRGIALFAGTASYPGATAGAANVSVPWPIAVAAMCARNDRTFLNPNLAAAGRRGVSRALGFTQVAAGTATEYTSADLETLKAAQVNAAARRNNEIRNYGFRTLANLDLLPHWWDLSGSRAVMAFRARAAAIDEDVAFDQIDGNRVLLDRYESLLRDSLADLHRRGALYGASPSDAYSVDTSDVVNPLDAIARGEVTATVRLKTSPFAEHVVTNIIRRALAAAEL